IMSEPLISLLALAIGAILAWLLASSRTRASTAVQLATLEARCRSAEEGRADLARRVQQGDQEIARLRGVADNERDARARIATELEARCRVAEAVKAT